MTQYLKAVVTVLWFDKCGPWNRAVVAMLLVLAISGSTFAQQLTPDEAKSIAAEAYIYGFPIVENYKTMYAYAVDSESDQYKAPFNTIKNRTRLFTPADTAVVTPNADTPYSLLWMDLRTEPLVLTVPEIDKERYYSIQLIDLYTFNFDYIGSRATGNESGRYLIAGPNWQGEKPDNIDKVIRSETDFAMAIYRTQLFGQDDLENVQQIQSEFSVQGLAEFLGDSAPDPATRLDFPVVNPQSTDEFVFFDQLNFALQFCAPHPSEAELMQRLAKIGVGKDFSFDASALSTELQQAINQGIALGKTAIAEMVPKANSAEIFGTRAYLAGDHLKRAAAAKVGLNGNSKEEALYPLYLTDAAGKPLDGSQQKYVINFAADQLPPARAFWSLTMYDVGTQALVANPIDRYLINSSMLDELKRNADGGLTLLIQHEPPSDESGGDKSSNWLPAPSGPFYMVMRLYWPEPRVLDGTWTPPLVWSEGAISNSTVQVPDGAGTAQEVRPSVLAEEPKPEMERPTVWGEPTEVKIAIYVIDIDEVNTAAQSFAGSVYVIASWKNPFLRHKGPGPMQRGLMEIWNPRLIIIGQQNVWRSYPEFVEISPEGEVVYRQKFWGNFSQPMELHDFPMDQQDLTIHIVTAGLSEQDITMVPMMDGDIEMSDIAETFSMPDFVVTQWQAETKPYYPHKGRTGTSGYQMKITVKRAPTYYVLKVIVPLCLIVIMSWLPRWIDPEQIGTNIGIATTAFLTLVAYLFAITVLLPKVSYVTRIDRFILLSTLLVFVGLLQTVWHARLIRKERKALVDRLDIWSRMVYPLLLLLVLAVSFLF